MATEIPPEKLGGAMLFFNKDTDQMEFLIPDRGEFRNMQNVVLETVDPVASKVETMYKHYFDSNTGEIKTIKVEKPKTKYRIKTGYTLDKTEGVFKDLNGNVATKEDAVIADLTARIEAMEKK